MITTLLLVTLGAPSPLGIDQHAMIGASLLSDSGELPSLGLDDEFLRRSVWLHLRAGVVDEGPSTLLGTQLGVEVELRLGVTPPESRALNDSLPVGFAGRVGLSMRALTFTVPFHGMIAAHVSVELGAGGARWWSDTARFSVLGGVRVAVGGQEGANLEIDYSLVPLTVSGSPGELQVRHLEHRLNASAGAGPIGLGIWTTFSTDQWRLLDSAPYQTTHGRSIGLSLEWRP